MPVPLMNAYLCKEGGLCVPLRVLNLKRKEDNKVPCNDIEWEGCPFTFRTHPVATPGPLDMCVCDLIAGLVHGQH